MTTQSAVLFHGCIVDQDEGSWSLLLAEYGERIKGILTSEMKRARVATEGSFDEEDLMQDLAGRMLSLRHHGFAGWHEGQIWSYLRRMARSVVVDHQRSRAAAKRPCENLRVESSFVYGIEGLPSDGPSPEDVLLAREGMRLVFRIAAEILGKEPSRLELRIVKLVLIDGLTSLEAADRVSNRRSAAQIDWLFHRLRRGFAARGIELPSRHGLRRSRSRLARSSRSQQLLRERT